MEYLNFLGTSGNKLNSITKEMKSNFFSKMSETDLNKHDELKYLILMREELFKYKTKLYCFNKWKSIALYGRDLIDEENPFIYNKNFDYKLFKKSNSKIKNKDSIDIDCFNNNSKDAMNNKNNNANIIKNQLNDSDNNFNLFDFNEDGNFMKNKNNNNIFNNFTSQLSDFDELLNDKAVLKKSSADKLKESIGNNKDKQNINIMNFNDLLARKSSIDSNNKNIQNESNKKEFNNFDELLIKSNTYKDKKNINIKDSLNVLNIQKNINYALANTNELFNKINLILNKVILLIILKVGIKIILTIIITIS